MRRAALLTLLLPTCALWASCSGNGTDPLRRPNILVLLADDLSPRALGAEGNSGIRTPELDALAAEGTAFARAYVPLPQCAPSRAALLLGTYPHQNGVLSNPDSWSGAGTSIADVLVQAGYRSGLVGKWHLGADDEPQAGFEHWRTLDRDHRSYMDPVLWVDGERSQEKGYLPEILTDHAIEFIDAEDERPFFLWLAYKTPHEPFTLPPDPAHAYDPAAVALPVSLSDDLSTKPAAQREGILHRRYLEADDDEVRLKVSTYYAMITALDQSVGRLLDHLERSGLAENTVVLFLSDNGLMTGEHRMITKGPAFYEELVRTPLFVRWPGEIASAQRTNALVSALDLLPTLAELGGAEVPPGLPGKSLLPLLRGEAASVHEELFLEYSRRQREATPMLGVVTQRHKYVRYLGSGEEELYDLEADPHELVNLVESAKDAQELERLRGRVADFQGTITVPFW